MTGARGVLCPYHDRVREVVVKQIAVERRADQHARIAKVIEVQAKPDLDALVHHWLYAGDVRRASRYAQHAARSAVQRLAFERAVSLYRFALEHEDDVERRKTLRDELATALVLDGRRALAADVYLAGLEAMSDAEAANARQRAGQ